MTAQPLGRRVCPKCGHVAFVIQGSTAWHVPCGSAVMLPDPRLGDPDPAEHREYERIRKLRRRRAYRQAGVL